MYSNTEMGHGGRGSCPYGANRPDLFPAQRGLYVAKILNGAQNLLTFLSSQPVKFEFVINLKTAKTTRCVKVL